MISIKRCADHHRAGASAGSDYHWMATISHCLPTFLRFSISRLRSVLKLPSRVIVMSLSLPTIAVSPIGIKASDTGLIPTPCRNAMSSHEFLRTTVYRQRCTAEVDSPIATMISS